MNQDIKKVDKNVAPATSTPVKELLVKEVTRKEFLKISGFGGLSVLGMSSFFQLLSGKKSSLRSGSKSSSGYGGGFYNK